jgi:hypothetical protein
MTTDPTVPTDPAVGAATPPDATGTPEPGPARPVDPLADLRRRRTVDTAPAAAQLLAVLPEASRRPERTGWRPRRDVFFVLLAAIALGSGAGGFLLGRPGGTGAEVPAGFSGTASAAPRPAPPTARPGDRDALLARVVAAPHGALHVDSGAFGLDDFADRDFPVNPYESARMRARGFEWMAERRWQTAQGIDYDVQLIEFAPGEGAQSMLNNWTDGVAEDPNTTASFSVAGLDRATGYLGNDPAGGDRFVALYAIRGEIVVLVRAFDKTAVDRAAAEAVLRTQVAALPG